MKHARYLSFSTVFGLALLAVVLPLRGIFGDFITTNIYLLDADSVQQEDVYVASTSARVDGTINGDLIISTGSLEISGTVTGDVLVLTHGPVEVTGTIGGSLRGIARNVVIDGTVADDVTVAAVSTSIFGTVSRDALVFGGALEMDGEVKGDVNGRMISAVFDGKVGHDVDISVGSLTLEGNTVVAGDLLYRSGVEANIAGTVQVGSQLDRLPTRGGWGVELILTVATVIGFLGFVFGGIVLIWLFRRTAPRSIDSVLKSPLRSAAVGFGTLVVAPVLIAILITTLVGVPVAVALLLLYVLGLFFGPVPAITAAGSKLLRSRWGLFAAFVVGAVIWRIGIWLIPLVGFALYLGALVVGVGGWVIGFWEERRAAPLSAQLLPVANAKASPATIPSPIGWDAPLAPGTRAATPPEADTDHRSTDTVIETHEYTTPDDDEPEND